MTGAKGNHIIQFHLRNLNCAFCASRIEEALRELPEVTALAFSVGTQKLQMTSTLDAKTLLPMVQHICDTIEEGVIVEDANAIKGEKEDQSNHAHEHGNGKNIFAIGEIVIGLMALIGIELFSSYRHLMMCIHILFYTSLWVEGFCGVRVEIYFRVKCLMKTFLCPSQHWGRWQYRNIQRL